jgi:hypothetical protein
MRASEVPPDLAGYFEPVPNDDIRSVWEVGTQAFSESHFATYPVSLVKPMVRASTSERGVCPVCGSQWARIVETNGGNYADRKGRGVGGPYNMHPELYGSAGCMGGSVSHTLGWRATCAHGAEPVPATILDPFSGAASTGVACMELGRSYVGIELSPEYVAMSEKRLRATQPGLVGL